MSSFLRYVLVFYIRTQVYREVSVTLLINIFSFHDKHKEFKFKSYNIVVFLILRFRVFLEKLQNDVSLSPIGTSILHKNPDL